MKVYGYARVSTAKQSITRQIDNIKAFDKNAIIMEEVFTGTEIDRPVWNRLMKIIKTGDTIIFDEVSRMSRNSEEGFTAYQELFDRGVNLIFLKERYIDSSMYASKLSQADISTGKTYLDEGLKVILMGLAKEQIKVAFDTAQTEVEHLHNRTAEGVEKAKKRYEQETALGLPHVKNYPGRQAGSVIETKKSKEMKEKIRKISKRYEGCMKDLEVIDTLKLARNTFYKYLREMKGAEE